MPANTLIGIGQPLICLVTGARMPASLTFARILNSSGARVFMADSIQHPPSRYSRSVERYFWVPSPNREPRQFIDAIVNICESNNIKLLIPMYEETFVISWLRQELQTRCQDMRIFASEFDTICLLHNKYAFSSYCVQVGVKTPETLLLGSRQELDRKSSFFKHDIVLKPVFSRFGGSVLINPSQRQLAAIHPSERDPWILQQRIRGKTSSSYGIAIDGKILCHASYDSDVVIGANRRNGIGASLIYQPNNDPRPCEIAETLLGPLKYTGQFGFDFIEQDNELYCLECNPRSTSGIHLLEGDVDMISILSGQAAMQLRLGSAANHVLLLYCLITLSVHPWNWQVLKGFGCRDVAFRLSDPLPFVVMNLLYLQYQLKATRKGTSGTDLFFEDLACDLIQETHP